MKSHLLRSVLMVWALGAGFLGSVGAQEKLTLWTVEAPGPGGQDLIRSAVQSFTNKTGVAVQVEGRSVDQILSELQRPGAKNRPDLVWTVGDHLGPLVKAQQLQNLAGEVDPRLFQESTWIPARGAAGELWGVPVSFGNHLMLFYHKSLVPQGPKTADELIKIAQSLTQMDRWGLVFPAEDPFWFMPWLGAFGGQVFDRTGVQPNLNTLALRRALEFYSDLKHQKKILPKMDYNQAHQAFLSQDAEGIPQGAMIINGDWALAEYRDKVPDLGAAVLPQVTSTGLWPAPYVNGKYLLAPVNPQAAPGRKALVTSLIKHLTSKEVQSTLQGQSLKPPPSGRASP